MWPRFRKISKWAFLAAQTVKNLPTMQETWVRYLGGEGWCPEKENGYSLQYSCLENPMDKGVWRTTVYGVARVGHDWVTNTFTQFSKCIVKWERQRGKSHATFCVRKKRKWESVYLFASIFIKKLWWWILCVKVARQQCSIFWPSISQDDAVKVLFRCN